MLRIGLAGAGMVSRHHLIAWRAQSHRAQVVAIAADNLETLRLVEDCYARAAFL